MENTKVDQQTVNDFLFASNISLSPQQKTLFTQMAIKNNLDPSKREIYAISYWTNLTIVTSYTVYLNRAYASGLMNGWDAQIEKKDWKVTGWTITIHRKDMQFPIIHSVAFSEIAQSNQNWTKKPEFMTRKTLISQGMRLAFPEFMAWMPYTEDEMDWVYSWADQTIWENKDFNAKNFDKPVLVRDDNRENYGQKLEENSFEDSINQNLEIEKTTSKKDLEKSFEADVENAETKKPSLQKKTLADIPKVDFEDEKTWPISTKQITDLKNAWTSLGFDAKSVPDAKLWAKLLDAKYQAKSSKELDSNQADELLDYLLSSSSEEIKKLK